MVKFKIVDSSLNNELLKEKLNDRFFKDGYLIKEHNSFMGNGLILEKSILDSYMIMLKKKGNDTFLHINGTFGGPFSNTAIRISTLVFIILSILFFMPLIFIFGLFTLIMYYTKWRATEKEIIVSCLKESS